MRLYLWYIQLGITVDIEHRFDYHPEHVPENTIRLGRCKCGLKKGWWIYKIILSSTTYWSMRVLKMGSCLFISTLFTKPTGFWCFCTSPHFFRLKERNYSVALRKSQGSAQSSSFASAHPWSKLASRRRFSRACKNGKKSLSMSRSSLINTNMC